MISVESELASCGEEIARELAAATGVDYYSDEIVEEAADISGIPLKLLRRYEERPVWAAYDLTAENEGKIKLPRAGDFIAAQLAACRALAEQGSCILLNHHANLALGSHENHFRVFVHADWDSRVYTYAVEQGICPSRAEKELLCKGRARRRYFRSVTRHWGDARNYDLTINSTSISPVTAAKNIVDYLETVTREVIRPRPMKAPGRSA